MLMVIPKVIESKLLKNTVPQSLKQQMVSRSLILNAKELGTIEDCSGFIWGIYTEAGFPYEYKDAKLFPTSKHFTRVSNPQIGDVGICNNHMFIYGATKQSGSYYNAWSAPSDGGMIWGKIRYQNICKTPPTWYRYLKI
jgi:hypothetical protein